MRPLAFLCSSIWIALAACEAAHAAARLEWRGYAPFSGPGFSLVLLWIACAVTSSSRRPGFRLLAAVGAFSPIVHGVVIGLGGQAAGYLFIAAGALLGFALFSAGFETRPVRKFDTV